MSLTVNPPLFSPVWVLDSVTMRVMQLAIDVPRFVSVGAFYSGLAYMV
jgi:hypothetical protein